MPRPPRVEVPGGVYHVTAHGNTGRGLFRGDADREQFLSLFETVCERRGWCCRAYCLLSTHYHLMVQTTDTDLAVGMQLLNSRYAQWANWSRGEKGHVFEGRYYAALLGSDAHYTEVYRYIALNPVRAALCARPEDWPWSSYAALLGLRRAPSFLDTRAALLDFAPNPVAARARIRDFVEDGDMSSRRDRDRCAA